VIAATVTAKTFTDLADVYISLNPAASSFTYNPNGTIATETVSGVTTSYTYNADGSVATSARAGVTRTYTYNADGTLASVS
jgi:uncharacterized protein RhaS with RHS repeats